MNRPSGSDWKQRFWFDLHSRAVALKVVRPDVEREWLRCFANRIPCPGCRAHWLAVVKAHPPDLRSRRLLFRWTVRAHNEINRMLGKKTMPFREACRLWGFHMKNRSAKSERPA